MSWAADGHDGNGLHLGKNEANFFKFTASLLKNSPKLRLWFIFSLKIYLISSSLCSVIISCMTKLLSSNLRQF